MATTPQSPMGSARPGPSDSLISAFRSCPRDPTEEIESRLSRMLEAFVHHCPTQENERNKELVEKCRLEAEIRYYKILEDIVRETKERADVLTILYVEQIQSCLVACSLDITATLNQLPCDLTVLLQSYKLAAYHLPLVIELVFRSRKDHSSPEAKHLHRVEIRILERLAWTGDSPLWKEIKVNDNRFPACQKVMSPTQLEDPMRVDLPEPDQTQAPVSLEVPTDVDHFCSTPAATRPLKNVLDFFARKVYKLMACRLSGMSSKLGISDERRWNIWTCFEQSLVHRSSLMMDGHLDLLLLHTIFNVTKITNSSLTLYNIVDCYRSQHYASKTVWDDMLILGAMENRPTEMNEDGDPAGIPLTPVTPSGPEMKDRLVRFQQDYRKKMQHFVAQFAPTFGGDTPQSPYRRLQKKSVVHYRLHDDYNIFISLLEETKFTRTPGLCYYFGSSTSEILHEISSKIKAGGSRKRVRRAVSFEEDSPSSKRLQLDGQSALERRLKSVADDRASIGSQDQV